MSELGKLLEDNAILICNLLMQDANDWEKAAEKSDEKEACLGYAKFRRELADKIIKLKP